MSHIVRKPTTDQGEVCPIAPRRPIVYLSVPGNMRHANAYAASIRQLRARHPDALLLEPALWHDWRPGFRPLLDSVTHHYLVTRPDGTIDRASFHEYLFFGERCIPTWALTPRGIHPVQKIIVYSEDFDSWLFTASVLTGAGGETAPGAA